MGILLVYDVTDEESYENVRLWMRNIEQHAAEDVDKILLGNKCDLSDKRVVDTESAVAFAEKLGVDFMETSARTNQNVEEAFIKLAQQVLKRLSTRQEEVPEVVGVTLYDKHHAGKEGCCS